MEDGDIPFTMCSWSFELNNNSEIIENFYQNRTILKRMDILGRETNNKGLYIEIYNDGSVQKNYLIE